MLKLNNRGSSHLLLVLALVVVLGVVGTYTIVHSHASVPYDGSSTTSMSYYDAKCPKPHKNVYPGQANDAYCVKLLQAALNTKAGGSYGLGVDGSYGSASYNAVKSYQSHHGLSSDGYVGANTWKSIDAVVGL